MALNNLDLNKLKCFQAVAQKGGLQEGAKYLNLTPSAVYQSIKKLEEELQKHLFFRSGKKYVLTDEGRSLQEIFQKFLWDFSEFQEHVDVSSGQTLEGEIRVGLPLNFSKAIFVPLMTEFNALYPRVRFQVTVAETRRLINQITAFELDFIICDDAIPVQSQGKIVKEEVYKEELILVCSNEFAQDNQKELSQIKLMKELTHLDYARNLPLIQRWYKQQYKRQVKIFDFHIIDNVETMVAALKGGLGLGIIPLTLLNDPALKKSLHVVPTQNHIYNQLFLVQEGNYINNTLMKKFLEFLATSIKSA